MLKFLISSSTLSQILLCSGYIGQIENLSNGSGTCGTFNHITWSDNEKLIRWWSISRLFSPRHNTAGDSYPALATAPTAGLSCTNFQESRMQIFCGADFYEDRGPGTTTRDRVKLVSRPPNLLASSGSNGDPGHFPARTGSAGRRNEKTSNKTSFERASASASSPTPARPSPPRGFIGNSLFSTCWPRIYKSDLRFFSWLCWPGTRGDRRK